MNSPSLMDQTFGDGYHQIDELISGFRRYRILLWALESGIADILNKEGQMDSDLLSSRLGYRPEFALVWIDALVESGFIERTGNVLRLSSVIMPYLVRESPLYQGDSIRMASEGIWKEGVDLFRIGADSKGPARKMSPEFLRVVCQHSMRGELPDITKNLCQRKEFSSARRLLDIGGGHGMYSISFCQQNPVLSALILDRPSITPFTEGMIEQYGMTGRISVVAGDMYTEIPGSGYDIVYSSHILYRSADMPTLLRNIIKTMNPGGLFVSNHKFADDWIIPENDATSALDMIVTRDHHRMISDQEFTSYLESAGLSDITSTRVRASTGFSRLHLGTRTYQ